MSRKTVRVQPLPDGVDQRSSWQVKVSGARVSSHTQKSAALSMARQKASDGDRLVVHGTNGQILRDVTVQRASASSNKDDKGGVLDDRGLLDEDVNIDGFSL